MSENELKKKKQIETNNDSVTENDDKEEKEAKKRKKRKTKSHSDKKDGTKADSRDASPSNFPLEDTNEEKNVKKELREINRKLEQMITKDDHRLKEIITEVVDKMKETLLASVEKRIDILESSLLQTQIENDKLKQKVEVLEEKLTNRIKENKQEEIELQFTQAGRLNELEQYGRRNNIVIHGIKEDPASADNIEERPETTASKVIDKLNTIPGVDLKVSDIDMCHRLGRKGSERPIIVKLTSRMVKINIMRKRKEYKDKNMFINEDLTKLNRHVLGLVRKQIGDNGRVWSRDGKILVRQGEGGVRAIQFKEYKAWMGLDTVQLLKH